MLNILGLSFPNATIEIEDYPQPQTDIGRFIKVRIIDTVYPIHIAKVCKALDITFVRFEPTFIDQQTLGDRKYYQGSAIILYFEGVIPEPDDSKCDATDIDINP